MSYGAAAALQAAVYQALSDDAALTALVGNAIFDTAPPGPLPPIYVALGSEDVRDRSDMTGHGAAHDLLVSVVADAGGFQTAKQAAAAVSDVLVDADLSLSRGALVSMQFLRATARQTSQGRARRIDLRFRARVSDD
ncbi:DUF3168 domain-containing protein [Frigidibacter sp. ROC022]|uniref:DUF3168 domain-containing protein n=1 Tax=Frigidibacter sp. ROC022 TaxID=2971796 RepID=UPI00215A79F4|nr:DUF3168 domain-containing protein [Frigidibacter sp. ROC022]MCR8723628.1 DUF3168 domain-containing protein [Frigidibacter sp. ROC022]